MKVELHAYGTTVDVLEDIKDADVILHPCRSEPTGCTGLLALSSGKRLFCQNPCREHFQSGHRQAFCVLLYTGVPTLTSDDSAAASIVRKLTNEAKHFAVPVTNSTAAVKQVKQQNVARPSAHVFKIVPLSTLAHRGTFFKPYFFSWEARNGFLVSRLQDARAWSDAILRVLDNKAESRDRAARLRCALRRHEEAKDSLDVFRSFCLGSKSPRFPARNAQSTGRVNTPMLRNTSTSSVREWKQGLINKRKTIFCQVKISQVCFRWNKAETWSNKRSSGSWMWPQPWNSYHQTTEPPHHGDNETKLETETSPSHWEARFALLTARWGKTHVAELGQNEVQNSD